MFLYKYNRFFPFHMIPVALLLITLFFLFLKLIILIACSLKNSQNFSIQSLCNQYIMLIFCTSK